MSKKAANKAEREHMRAVAALGCIVCRNTGFPDSPAECHHIRATAGAGQRSSHFEVIPLCFHHHSAQAHDGFHNSPKRWQERHGSETDLLSQVLELL